MHERSRKTWNLSPGCARWTGWTFQAYWHWRFGQTHWWCLLSPTRKYTHMSCKTREMIPSSLRHHEITVVTRYHDNHEANLLRRSGWRQLPYKFSQLTIPMQKRRRRKGLHDTSSFRQVTPWWISYCVKTVTLLTGLGTLLIGVGC